MAKVVKHAWTHRPRSEGGTDPIDVVSFMPSWCTASRGASATSWSSSGLGGYYRPRFQRLITNDTDCYELVGNSSDLSDYVQINKDGYYHAFFSIAQQTAGTSWGGIYTAIQAVMNSTGDVDLETQLSLADWHPTPNNPLSEALVEEDYGPPSHSALTLVVALDFRAGETFTSPFQLACRLFAESGSSFNLVTQMHIVRLADGENWTRINSSDLS